MFEELFVRYHAISRYRKAPLLKERLSFLSYCAEQEMSRSTLKEIASYQLIIIDFFDLETRGGEVISLQEIEDKADLWLARVDSCGDTSPASSRQRFIKNAKHWFGYQNRLEKPPVNSPPYADLITEYRNYEQNERNCSRRSIDLKCRILSDFFSQVYEVKNDLSSISITDIDEVLVRKSTESGYALTTLQTYASTLRTFLRYAECRKWCKEGLADLITTPRVYQHDSLPLGPSWEDVQKLLATTKGDNPSDIRDRAILLLFALYGFRNREVTLLQLEDLDWERELLYVTRPKQRKKQAYPLTRSAGDAILQYLRTVRPRSKYREVFLTIRAPYTPVNNSTIYAIVSRRLLSLGISLQHYGPHSLRHACASRLLQENFSLKEIGDHLGHKNPETTRIYAKVDINGLREVGDFEIQGVL